MELDRYLSRSEIEFLAARDPPRSLVEHQARLWLRHEQMEQKRIAKEAAERKAFEAAEEMRLAAAARPIVRQPVDFSEKQLQTLCKVLGSMWAELDAKIDAKAEPARAGTVTGGTDTAAPVKGAPGGGVEVVSPTIVSYINSRLSGLAQTVKDLDASSLRYSGVWRSGTLYRKGSAVTHQGGMWLAIEDCDLRPGQDSNWKLIVKSGEAPQPGKRTTEEKTADHAHRLKEIEGALKKLEEQTAWKRHG